MCLADLRRRAEPIRVGVVGVGRMGRGVVDQVSTMAGMRLMAAADVDLGRAEACLRENGADPVVADPLGGGPGGLRRGGAGGPARAAPNSPAGTDAPGVGARAPGVGGRGA